MSAKKESGTDKIPCPVCGKMISAVQGRTVHDKSKFHQDALKRQQEKENPPETKEEKEEPETKPPETKEDNNQEEKPPKTKEEIKSGLKGDDPKEKGLVDRFLGWLTEDDDE